MQLHSNLNVRRPKGTGQITELGAGKYRLRAKVPNSQKRPQRTVSAKSRSEAERKLRSWITEIENGRFKAERVTMNRLFDLYEADLARHGRASGENVRLKLKKFLRPRFGGLLADSLKKSEIEAYKDERLRTGASPATINRELSYLGRSLRLGLEDDLINKVIPIRKLKEDNARQGFFEHSAYLAVREKLPQHQRLLFVCAYHWGMRRGELLRLRWEWVYLNEAKPLIKIPGPITKSGRPRTIPIYGDLYSWLSRAKAERDQLWPSCPWVFIYRGRRLRDPRDGFRAAAESAGYPSALFHDLRRTAIRNMEAALIPRAEAMQISGHRTESVYKRYDISSERGAIRAGELLAEHLKTLDAQATQPSLIGHG
jgi:integrase